MIITSKKLLFLHIPRTAGTSITQYLKEYYGVLGVPEHLDLFKHDLIEKGYSDERIEKIVNDERIQERIKNYKYGKHSNVHRYIDIFGKEYFDSLYTFSVVRNPWDRMVSWYIYGTQKQFNENEFAKWLPLKKRDNQLQYIEIDGEIVADTLCRFENLRDDLAKVYKKLKIPKKELKNLPTLNKTKRRPYQEYYNDESKKIVEELFAEEIELFNYTF